MIVTKTGLPLAFGIIVFAAGFASNPAASAEVIERVEFVSTLPDGKSTTNSYDLSSATLCSPLADPKKREEVNSRIRVQLRSNKRGIPSGFFVTDRSDNYLSETCAGTATYKDLGRIAIELTVPNNRAFVRLGRTGAAAVGSALLAPGAPPPEFEFHYDLIVRTTVYLPPNINVSVSQRDSSATATRTRITKVNATAAALIGVASFIDTFGGPDHIAKITSDRTMQADIFGSKINELDRGLEPIRKSVPRYTPVLTSYDPSRRVLVAEIKPPLLPSSPRSVVAVSVSVQYLEPNTNRGGGDYRSFDIKPASPGSLGHDPVGMCRGTCEGDPKCRAWTLVKAGIQGPNQRCWLKSVIPSAFGHACCTAGVVARTWEPGIGRTGNDYKNPPAASAEQCRSACENDRSTCKAWTFVAPGYQGPGGKCWLKNAVPRAAMLDGRTSGVIAPPESVVK